MKVRAPNEYENGEKAVTAKMLARDRVSLLITQPFIGMIAMRLELIPVWDSRCTTASTDGESIFVHPDFYNHLSPGQRIMLLAHEVWHVVYAHFLRRGNREHALFNVACDMEVNRMLQENGMELIKGCLLPDFFWQHDNAEQIYEHLKKEQEKGGGSSHAGECLDEHMEPGENINAHAKGNEVIHDADFEVNFSHSSLEEIREKVCAARSEYKRKYGDLPDNIVREIEPLCKPQINWREMLAQFVTSCFNGERRWLPPNRRFVHQGLYLQSRRDKCLKAVIALDTSGSTIPDLPAFLAEVNGLISSFGNYELTVIQCDAKIQSVQTFTPDSPMPEGKMKLKGGGGTSFDPVFRYVEKNLPDTRLLLYLTDGYGSVEKTPPPYPMLWCLTEDGAQPVKWGTVCRIPHSQKNRRTERSIDKRTHIEYN